MGMDNERTRRLNEAVQKYTESAMESYETVWDHFARAQESQGQLTQGLFEDKPFQKPWVPVSFRP